MEVPSPFLKTVDYIFIHTKSPHISNSFQTVPKVFPKQKALWGQSSHMQAEME